MFRVTVVNDNPQEPISIVDVKNWLQIDYNDFDSLLNMLITACREKSEQMSGLAYYEKTIQVKGNEMDEKVYPIGPFIEDVVWEDEDGVIDYRYKAGFECIPQQLKVAILQRIATGFAYRQNGLSEAVNRAMNQSYDIELKYRNDLTIL